MTCRCIMCGVNNAGRPHRGSYVRAGVRCDESVARLKAVKRAGRRLRRFREDRAWRAEHAATCERDV